MRNLFMLSTLSIVATGILTGGIASANTMHREPVRTTVVHEVRTPVRERVEVRSPVVQRERIEQRPVVINRGFDTRFENMRYDHGRYVRAGFNERYFDIRVQPAPIFEDIGAPVAGCTWVAGNWQWSGAEWTWIAGHYIAC
jgi:hypothetical protein